MSDKTQLPSSTFFEVLQGPFKRKAIHRCQMTTAVTGGGRRGGHQVVKFLIFDEIIEQRLYSSGKKVWVLAKSDPGNNLSQIAMYPHHEEVFPLYKASLAEDQPPYVGEDLYIDCPEKIAGFTCNLQDNVRVEEFHTDFRERYLAWFKEHLSKEKKGEFVSRFSWQGQRAEMPAENQIPDYPFPVNRDAGVWWIWKVDYDVDDEGSLPIKLKLAWVPSQREANEAERHLNNEAFLRWQNSQDWYK